MLACVQAGIYGQDLEDQLRSKFNMTMGHEPVSKHEICENSKLK